MANDPYSRIYWRFAEEYPAIFDDKPTFGWWATLLVIADGAHPSPGNLPRSVNPKSLAKLVDCGLVELLGGDRYRIKGLTAERTRRTQAALAGGLARQRLAIDKQSLSSRYANGEPRKEEQEKRQAMAQERLDAGEFATYGEALEAVLSGK